MSVAENQYFNQLESMMRGFTYNSRFHFFFAHPYNVTWANERCVEIPVFANIIKKVKDYDAVLEVGNVLTHYGMDYGQNIVDLFEKHPRVINDDILNYNPSYKYDLIVSISTLEHIGKDDELRPEKALEALDHLKSLLAPGGRLIASIPLGYNTIVDGWLNWEFDRVDYMQSLGHFYWRQLNKCDLRPIVYDQRGANTVAFCYYQRA
jgi:SAM-dependent methyltransferase